MVHTYDEYARQYYQANKDRIRERTRAYRKEYNKEYYQLHKEEILKKLAQRRLLYGRLPRKPKKSRKYKGVFEVLDKYELF